MDIIIKDIPVGKVYCSSPFARVAHRKGCPLGLTGGWCIAFKKQREEGREDYKRLPECIEEEKRVERFKKIFAAESDLD